MAKELYVFQRTPSTIDVRDQRATTDEERAAWANEPGLGAGPAGPLRQDLRRTHGDPGQRRLPGRQGRRLQGAQGARHPAAHPEELVAKQLDSNFRIMEQIRARVDAIVEDPVTAEALKPYYPYGCKRPTFHDEYLPTFNLPHVHLVDTAPLGVSKINERGVVHDGVEYPLDVLVYATGFTWMATSTFNMVVGRRRALAEREVVDRGHQDVPRPAQPRLPEPVHRHRPAGRRRQLQLHRRHRHPLRLRRVDADRRCATGASDVVDVDAGVRGGLRRALPPGRHRHRPAARLHLVLQRPRRGRARQPRLLRRRQWHKWRRQAQESLTPYAFQGRGPE